MKTNGDALTQTSRIYEFDSEIAFRPGRYRKNQEDRTVFCVDALVHNGNKFGKVMPMAVSKVVTTISLKVSCALCRPQMS